MVLKMINVKELEEFQFVYGDPRSYFHDYILTLPNIACYLPKIKTFHRKAFKFRCNKQIHKRSMDPPSESALKHLEDNIASGTDPMIIVPLLLHNKYRCRINDASKHSNLVLYNRYTHEVERLDIKRYHTDGYNMKLFIKKLDNVFMTNIVKEHDKHKDVTLIVDLDVPLAFIQKHGFSLARDAYPLFLLAYLNMRSVYPHLTSSKIIKKTIALSKTRVANIWKDYKAFREQALLQDHSKKTCPDDRTLNPENRRCMRPLSVPFNRLVVEKPPKDCKRKGHVYNTLLERCVSSKKVVDVDVLLDKVLPFSDKARTEVLTHVDRKSLEIVTHLMSQYPHAHFIHSTTGGGKRKDFVIKWAWEEEKGPNTGTETGPESKPKGAFKLTLPPGYWEMWEAPMTNPSIRFVITFVKLISNLGGIHANVLIYDKSTNEFERFDGLGQYISSTYKAERLDKVLQTIIEERVPILFKKSPKYFVPLDYCPKFMVFQAKEINNIPGADIRGNCAVWRFWYINIRLQNPQLKRKELVLLASRKLQNTGSLYKFIKSYHAYLNDMVKNDMA